MNRIKNALNLTKFMDILLQKFIELFSKFKWILKYFWNICEIAMYLNVQMIYALNLMNVTNEIEFDEFHIFHCETNANTLEFDKCWNFYILYTHKKDLKNFFKFVW